MKKILFIMNITNQITNFAIPSIVAAQEMGYEFHLAANCSNFTDDASKYHIKIHHIDIDRNPYNFKQNRKAYRQMLSLINDEKFDAIHCCFLQVLFAESCKLKIQNVALWKIHSFAS